MEFTDTFVQTVPLYSIYNLWRKCTIMLKLHGIMTIRNMSRKVTKVGERLRRYPVSQESQREQLMEPINVFCVRPYDEGVLRVESRAGRARPLSSRIMIWSKVYWRCLQPEFHFVYTFLHQFDFKFTMQLYLFVGHVSTSVGRISTPVCHMSTSVGRMSTSACHMFSWL